MLAAATLAFVDLPAARAQTTPTPAAAPTPAAPTPPPAPDGTWSLVRVPGAWETNGPAGAAGHDGFAWYRAWLRPHDSFFTPHERNLFAESVTLNLRGLADAHEAYVNGALVGRGGSFPPNYVSGRDGNHRHKIPPGLLRRGEWNEIALRVYNPSGPGGLLTEAPFVMDYFNECTLAGDWEWRPDDLPPASMTGQARAERPPRAAFDRYQESHRVLGEADQFVPGPRLSPSESAAGLIAAPDLAAELLLHEPLVAQPTHLSFDARGRLWVAQYRQYPYPAGLRMLSRDKYYRAQYDKVPPPPPHHDRGRDRITIHEDTNGDGLPDRHKVFLDGLNMANAVLPGPDGVWVMHTPYLLFYADADGDDTPDGPPTVHLAGFGLEDTHSVANGLVWGPDGWIYGAQGSTTSSRVTRPGIDPPGADGVYFEGCMVWRYHPGTRVYELFAEGSGNVFGLEFDGEGRLFSGHNGPETRGWHYQQGAYYMKQGVDPGKFGPPRNPHAFGELPWLKPSAPIQRFTHFLAVVEGTGLPAARQGQLFWIDPIHSLVLASERTVLGSTFGTRDLGVVVTNRDSGFRPVYIVNAPDGSLLVADFYEHYIAHGQHYQSQIDPTTGRIYRLRGRGQALETNVAPVGVTDAALSGWLAHDNKWHRFAAAREIARRAAARPAWRDELRQMLTRPDAPLAALWALHQAGGLDDPTVLALLGHPSAPLREWTIRLVGDRRQASPRVAAAFADLAATEPAVRTRAQLAATARRLPAPAALPIIAALARRDEDAADPCVPLLCWWTLDTLLDQATNRPAVLGLFLGGSVTGGGRAEEDGSRRRLEDHAIASVHLMPRLVRRLALEGRQADLLDCARLIRRAGTAAGREPLLRAFTEAFRGRDMTGLPDELLAALADAGGAGPTRLLLRLRQRDPEAVRAAVAALQARPGDASEPLALLRALGELAEPSVVPTLVDLALQEPVRSPSVRQAALGALAAFPSESLPAGLPGRLIAALPGLPGDVRTSALAFLTSRPGSTRSLLEAIGERRIDPGSVPPEMVDRLRHARDPEIRSLAQKVLPARGSPRATNADPTVAAGSPPSEGRPGAVAAAGAGASRQRLQAVAEVLKARPGNPYQGEAIYAQRCAACHKLFFKGGRVGPDLTPYPRDQLDNLLLSILQPNAEIREGYTAVEIETRDGRSLTGFLVERDARVVVMRGLDGQDVTLRTADIQSLEATGRSLMPEGLIDDLSDDSLRDLFAYLRSAQPFTR